ncbi:hypothetical protein [Duganella sp. BuS-21]|uniref:hypothetical protein n=1 Tax=Duganella sp. BuS-21 TaxID=2943848 RepID=UPI0035A5F9EE
MDEKQHRIAFAYFLENWTFSKDSSDYLRANGEKITPEEYRSDMKGSVFCPECSTPLSRAPEIAEIFTNERTAHFRHKGTYKAIYCSLRVSRAAGLQYHSEEEARRAIQNENLVLIGGWAENPPEIRDDDDADLEFRQTQIVDPDGPMTEMPLGRHIGRTVLLPTKISSVLAICRNFDKNIHRAFYFPDSQYALHLRSILYDVTRLIDSELPERGNLYFGKIVGFSRLSHRNIIYLKVENFPELKIYTYPRFDERKKIDSESVGRVLLFYGIVSDKGEGVPRCMTTTWGQYSLLPKQYEKFLPWYTSN